MLKFLIFSLTGNEFIHIYSYNYSYFIIIIMFTEECFPHCACVSENWTLIKSTRYLLTSYRWTTNGTGTHTTSRRGWSRARLTHQHLTGCTLIQTHRSPVTSYIRRSCRLKKSNSPTTKWTLADK